MHYTSNNRLGNIVSAVAACRKKNVIFITIAHLFQFWGFIPECSEAPRVQKQVLGKYLTAFNGKINFSLIMKLKSYGSSVSSWNSHWHEWFVDLDFCDDLTLKVFVCLFLLFVWNMASLRSSDWFWNYCVAQVGLKLAAVLLMEPHTCCYYRRVPPFLPKVLFWYRVLLSSTAWPCTCNAWIDGSTNVYHYAQGLYQLHALL